MSQPIPLQFPPGVVKSQSALGAAGRYIDCDGIRFWQGKPQKLGGQVALTASPFIGYPRGMGAWNDLTGRQILSIGTVMKLYAVGNNDWQLIDITPLISTAALTNPYTTVNGSTLVNVAWAAHGVTTAGQYIDLAGGTAVGGLTLAGSYPVQTVVDANNLTIVAASAATSSATGGGSVAAGLEPIPGVQDPAVGYGWSAGAWNAGAWNTPRTTSNIIFVPRYWTINHFGKILLSCFLNGGIYSWDPTIIPTPRATLVPNAPTLCTGFVMTSDYIMIAYGSNYGGTQNYMQWWACAQGDYTNWDVTAFAGPQGSPSVEGVLAEGTVIIGAADLGNHVTLLLTDTSVYAFQFTGSASVFDVTRAGKECGLIGPLAIIPVDSVAYWMGNNGFYMYSGGVSPIPNQNDIMDWVFSQIPYLYGIKSVASYNEKYKEVWFSFVGAGETEPSISVVYNTIFQFWFVVYSVPFSSATRFTGADDRPIFGKTDGYIYQMDNGLDVVAPGGTSPQDWWLTTAPTEVMAGAVSYAIDTIIADNERQVGNVTLELTAYDRSPAAPVVIDSFASTFTPASGSEDFRICGRLIQAQWSGSGIGCDIRFGVWQALQQGGGART